MKLTRYLALAAVMIMGLLAFTAFAGNRDTSLDVFATASISSDPAFVFHKQTVPVREAAAIDRTVAALEVHKAWVQERVGVSPLDIYRATRAAIQPLDGYGDVLMKPKIESNAAYYRGLGHDHYARADV